MKDKLNEEDLLIKLNDIICFDKTVKLNYNDIRFIFELIMYYRDKIHDLLKLLGDDKKWNVD